eukprot:MONOS_16582.1-p1 / transcript=MONOS_16582.1 / gene=MONOS_16582 / organism=Monocercomonoides_exilis_PA203 / gene_product=unspecified product / transcript_product=unspecified product / location=Mono_scaffold01883:13-1326(-) / protein_length=430 / sequence_SO=supercontig / SO=protein_coding / is_pseudo=false
MGTRRDRLDADVGKGGRGVDGGGGADPEDVADGRGDVEDGCGEGGAGGKLGAALAGRGAGVLVDEYLVGAVEGDEGEEVDIEVGVSGGGVGAADGGVGGERGLGEVEGKEGLVDLGGDGGAPEKEVLSSEGVVEGEAEVEDGEGDGRSASRAGAVEEEAAAPAGRAGADALGEDARRHAQLRLVAVEAHHCGSALGRLFAHAAGEHTRLGSTVDGTSPLCTHQSRPVACAHDVGDVGRVQNDGCPGVWGSQASQASRSSQSRWADGHEGSASEQRGGDREGSECRRSGCIINFEERARQGCGGEGAVVERDTPLCCQHDHIGKGCLGGEHGEGAALQKESSVWGRCQDEGGVVGESRREEEGDGVDGEVDRRGEEGVGLAGCGIGDVDRGVWGAAVEAKRREGGGRGGGGGRGKEEDERLGDGGVGGDGE